MRVAKAAILAHEELRHHEHRDALDPLGSARHPRQHQVDDVVRQVVLARRDPDLLPRQAVAAVVLRLGPGPDQAQVGAALRLGQVHRAGPRAIDHLRQIKRLLRLRPMRRDRRDRAMGQAEIHLERHVGGGEILARREVQDRRHPLSAERLGRVHRRPAAGAHRVIGGLEPLRRAHHPVLEAAALPVAHRVQRRQHLRRDLPGLAEHRLRELRIQIGIAGDVLLRDLQHVVQDELGIPHGGGVARHRRSPVGGEFGGLFARRFDYSAALSAVRSEAIMSSPHFSCARSSRIAWLSSPRCRSISASRPVAISQVRVSCVSCWSPVS